MAASGKVSLSDFQQEYDKILKNVKALASELKAATPEHIQERLKKEVLRAYDTLEMMAVPKRDRVSKLIKDFQEDSGLIIAKSTVYFWLGTTEEEEENEIPVLENQNSSLYAPKNAKYEQENALELEVADRAHTFVNLWKTVLRGSPWASLRDPAERKQSLALMNAVIGMAIQSLDGRRLVQTPTQAHLVQCALTYMPQDAYAHHLDKVKDVAKKMTAQFKVRGIRTIENITGKRLTAILTLNVKDVDESLDPASPLEAKMKGFAYQRCPNCKDSCKKCRGYRCNRLPDATEGRWYTCECCDHKFEGIIIPPFMAGTVIEKKINETLENFKQWKQANGIKD